MRGQAIDVIHGEDEVHGFLKLAVAREHLHLRVPSKVDWVERTALYLADRAETLGACDARRRGNLVTALTEALTNAIVHGNLEISSELKEQPDGQFAQALAERAGDSLYADRLVEVEMSYDGRECIWTITDQGPGFNVDRVLARLDNDDEPQAVLASGRGILLMRAFVDEVTWARGGRQVRLSVRRPACERRNEVRHPTTEAVRALPLADSGAIDWEAAFDAVAGNVSYGGVALLKQGLDAAQRLMIELQVDGRVVYLPAEVCNMTPIGDSMVQIGCRFRAPEPGGDAARSAQAIRQHEAIGRILERIGDPAAEVGDDRRQHQRRPYTRPIRLDLGDGVERLAVGRDLSRSGLAMIAGFPLSRGQAITVSLDDDVQLSATVRRCQQVAGRFHDIGVEFERAA